MHQSCVRVVPPSDNTSVITRHHAPYDFLCDTAIIVKKYHTGGASMTNNKHCDCAPLLNYFKHLLLRFDMNE